MAASLPTLFNCAQFQNTYLDLLKDLDDPTGLLKTQVDIRFDTELEGFILKYFNTAAMT